MTERCLWAHPCAGCGEVDVTGNAIVCQICLPRIPTRTSRLISSTLENLHVPAVARVNWEALVAAATFLRTHPPLDSTHLCVGCRRELPGHILICQTCFLRLDEPTRAAVSSTLAHLHDPAVAHVRWEALQGAARTLKDRPPPHAVGTEVGETTSIPVELREDTA